jgi:hypothetical protein
VSQQINLFNPRFEEEKKLFGAAAMAQALLVLLVGVLALSYYGSRSLATLQNQADGGARQVEKKKQQLATVSAELPPRQKSSELEARLVEAEEQLAALKRIASVIDRGELGNSTGYSEYFRALARQHAEGLWLTGLAITGAGRDIGVRGRALDASLLPGFLGRLAHEKVLQGKSFGSLQISQPAQAPAADKDGGQAKAGKRFIEFSLQSKPEGAQS